MASKYTLSELYQTVLTSVLNTPFPLTDTLIDRIHDIIITEIKSKCTILVNEGHLNPEDVGLRLDYEVRPILQAAKHANSQRSYDFSPNFRRFYSEGLFTRFPQAEYEIVEGQDNSNLLADMREWYTNLGDFKNYLKTIVFEPAGESFDTVSDQLQVTNLVETFINSESNEDSFSAGTVSRDATCDISIGPIAVTAYLHAPHEVEPVSVMRLDRTENDFPIAVRDDEVQYVTFSFPSCTSTTVTAKCRAHLKYSCSKSLVGRTWAKFATLGIGCFLDETLNLAKTHDFQIKFNLDSSYLSPKERLKIEVTLAQANLFLNKYKQFKDVMTFLTGNETPMPQALPLLANLEQYPWLEFIEALRSGGVEAAMNVCRKKPNIVRQLPVNENNACGVAFEELQIAKIMAEAIRRNIKLELIAGDGQGEFIYNQQTHSTPDYTDAVFKNLETGEMFAVQMKFSDSPVGIETLVQSFDQSWGGSADSHFPRELHHENVKLIGPSDVVPDVEASIRNRFKQDRQIQINTDDTKIIKRFLRDNKDLMKSIVESEEFQAQVDQRRKLSGINGRLKDKQENLKNLNKKLSSMETAQKEATANGRNTDGMDRGIDNVKQQKAALESEIHSMEVSRNEAKQSLDTMEGEMRKYIEKNINTNYLKRKMYEAALKEAAISVGVAAAIDGITTLLCTGPHELRRWWAGEITFPDMIKTVSIATAKSSIRGASYGLGFAGLTMASRIATAGGYSCATGLAACARFAGPAFMAGMLIKQSYDIITHWRNGDITTTELKKAFARLGTSTALNVGGMIAIGSLVGGPLGVVAGAGLCIAVAVGDHYLGDSIWSKVFKEDNEEQLELVLRRMESMKKEVLTAAYKLFSLTEMCTRDELRERYRAAVLKYHPDRGGDSNIFRAVHSAYGLICADRSFV